MKIRKRNNPIFNPESTREKLIKTIEDGVMTGDLYLLSSLENKKKVDTEEFLREIAVRLDEMM